MSSEDLKNEIISLINSGWTQGANARNAEGLPVPARNPDAVEWDIMGAIIKATEGFTDFTSYHEVLRELTDNMPEDYKSRDLEAYNDDAELSDILDLLGYAPAVSFAPRMYEGAMSGIQIDEYIPIIDLEEVQIYSGSVASVDDLEVFMFLSPTFEAGAHLDVADLEIGQAITFENAQFFSGSFSDVSDLEVGKPVDIEEADFREGASGDLDIETNEAIDLEEAIFHEGAASDLDDVEVPEPEPEPDPDPEDPDPEDPEPDPVP